MKNYFEKNFSIQLPTKIKYVVKLINKNRQGIIFAINKKKKISWINF